MNGIDERPVKPRVRLAGENGNIFHLLGICSRALKEAGQRDKVAELQSRVFAAVSYDEALGILLDYVEDGGDDPEGDDTDDEYEDEGGEDNDGDDEEYDDDGTEVVPS